MNTPAATRVLLKVSGEALSGAGGVGFAVAQIDALADEISAALETGVQLAVVVGGGNLFRGAELAGTQIQRDSADRMGMLATIMNALALRDTLIARGHPATILAGLPVPEIAETFTARRGRELLDRGEVVLCAGGTGHPYFTTDTAAALRALELGADLLLKATTVDGIYAADPRKDPTAERFDEISFGECLQRDLRVMDQTAFALCRENALPIVVFDMSQAGSIRAAASGERIGTRVVPSAHD